MNKTLTNALLVISFLAVLNFFAFYWTDAAGITSVYGYPTWIGFAVWVIMILGFVVLAIMGSATKSKLADIFFIAGMVINVVNFFVFLWLGPITSIINMPDRGETGLLGFLFFIMAVVAAGFLIWRATSKDLEDMFDC